MSNTFQFLSYHPSCTRPTLTPSRIPLYHFHNSLCTLIGFYHLLRIETDDEPLSVRARSFSRPKNPSWHFHRACVFYFVIVCLSFLRPSPGSFISLQARRTASRNEFSVFAKCSSSIFVQPQSNDLLDEFSKSAFYDTSVNHLMVALIHEGTKLKRTEVAFRSVAEERMQNHFHWNSRAWRDLSFLFCFRRSRSRKTKKTCGAVLVIGPARVYIDPQKYSWFSPKVNKRTRILHIAESSLLIFLSKLLMNRLPIK